MLLRMLSIVSILLACTPSSQGGAGRPPAAADGGASTPAGPAGADAPSTTPAGACASDADCGEGICEGQGCGDANGVCVPRERMCTRDAQIYCGCDGVEFRASGRCPGRRFAHRGACEQAQPKPDGAPCMLAAECASGVCEGEGCEHAGVCVAASRPCTKDLRQYCGCDGTTFSASGSCPGQRFASRSACP